MGRPDRIGLVGCGRLSERAYEPWLTRTPRVELAAVCDPDRSRRELIQLNAQASGQPPPEAFASTREMIENARLDALAVVSPVATHAEVAAFASAHGLRCLVEKPPAADAAESELMAQLEPAPMFAFNRRFGLGGGLRERVPATGEVRLRARLDYRRRSWGAVSVHDEALMDLATHLIDLALWGTGAAPTGVRCPRAERDRAELLVTTTRGEAELRCSTASLHLESIEVLDADGRRLHRHRIGGAAAAVGGRLRSGRDPLVTSIEAQLDRFADALDEGGSGGLATAADAVATMKVVDAARESLRRGGETVTIQEEDG